MMKILKWWYLWAFVWMGMILGVSFLATPAKFTSPLLERDVALDIGMRTFYLFTRMEWFMALNLALTFFLKPNQRLKWVLRLVVVILAVQSFYLLPALSDQVMKKVQDSQLNHTLYIALEVTKLALIALWAYFFMNEYHHPRKDDDLIATDS